MKYDFAIKIQSNVTKADDDGQTTMDYLLAQTLDTNVATGKNSAKKSKKSDDEPIGKCLIMDDDD